MKYSRKNIIKAVYGIAFLTVFISCIGPAGPPGTDGLDGADGLNGLNGINGEDGNDGVDANENCILCHNNSIDILVKQQQFMLSQHDSADASYQGYRSACAACHSHNGFEETQATGNDDAAADFDFAININCRTCHLIHTNFDESDWDLVTTSAVDLRLGGTTANFGLNSNICINCHQARNSSTLPVLGSGGTIEIISTHWGIHHGPETNLMLGEGGYEIVGLNAYPADGTNSHISAGCYQCHMSVSGNQMGGHTFIAHPGACLDCHGDIENLDYHGVQSNIETHLSAIKTICIAKGWINDEGNLLVPLTLSTDDAGALLNYLVVSEDGSLGIHNPGYITALMMNTLWYLEQ